MSETTSQPPAYNLALRILFGTSLLPIVAGLVAVFQADYTGRVADEQIGGIIFFVFIAAPISFVIALISSVVTWAKWHSVTKVDKWLGLLPLSFPIVGFFLAAGIGALVSALRRFSH